MPKIAYIEGTMQEKSLDLVRKADQICTDYARRGLGLTLRQLYYRFVANNWIRNKDTEYDRLGEIINRARQLGLIDWTHLEDRTRNLRSLSHWDTPGSIIRGAADSYQRNLWEDQDNYAEVWVEKDALVGVLEDPCSELDVPYFSCRGYTSASEMWRAAMRILQQGRAHSGELVVVHFGDHDPSGMDMSRDIEERIRGFLAHHDRRAALRFRLDRVALNMDQIERYAPPPNPAKLSDSRAPKYVAEYGDDSWELDALDPQVIQDLIRDVLEGLIDRDTFDAKRDQMEQERRELTAAAKEWTKVRSWMVGEGIVTDEVDADEVEIPAGDDETESDLPEWAPEQEDLDALWEIIDNEGAVGASLDWIVNEVGLHEMRFTETLGRNEIKKMLDQLAEDDRVVERAGIWIALDRP